MMQLAQGAGFGLHGLMLSKRQRPYDPQALAKRARLRRNIEDLFSSAAISTERLNEVAMDINRIDPVSFADVARHTEGHRGNKTRWWRRKLRKKWPGCLTIGPK